MIDHDLTRGKKESRIDKINRAIRQLSDQREALFQNRMAQITRTLKKSKAMHMPDNLIVGALRYVSELYDKNPNDPFIQICLDTLPHKRSRQDPLAPPET